MSEWISVKKEPLPQDGETVFLRYAEIKAYGCAFFDGDWRCPECGDLVDTSYVTHWMRPPNE